jgi:ABC-2 type transport system permease protein
VALLYASMALFILSTLGVGLLISTISSTQRQAMMTMFFFMLPAILLSGFAFPVSNMPKPVQWLTLLNPLRHFLEIIRGILLKGIGAEILWDRMLALFVIGAGMLALASARFRKTVR